MPGTHGHPTNPRLLLKWINVMLHSDYRSMSQLCSGAAWCRLLHCIYPDTFNVAAVQDVAGPAAMWQRNYDILLRALSRLDIPLDLRVQKLMSGSTRHSIELIHFFMDLYVQRKLAESRHRQREHTERGALKELLEWLKRLVAGNKSAADDAEAYLLLFEEMHEEKPLRKSQPTQTLSYEMLTRQSGGQEKRQEQEQQQERQQKLQLEQQQQLEQQLQQQQQKQQYQQQQLQQHLQQQEDQKQQQQQRQQQPERQQQQKQQQQEDQNQQQKQQQKQQQHQQQHQQQQQQLEQQQREQQQQREHQQPNVNQRRKDHDEIRPLIGACQQMLQFQNEMCERWQQYRRARLAQQQRGREREREGRHL